MLCSWLWSFLSYTFTLELDGSIERWNASTPPLQNKIFNVNLNWLLMSRAWINDMQTAVYKKTRTFHCAPCSCPRHRAVSYPRKDFKPVSLASQGYRSRRDRLSLYLTYSIHNFCVCTSFGCSQPWSLSAAKSSKSPARSNLVERTCQLHSSSQRRQPRLSLLLVVWLLFSCYVF